jgi:hypothetical protein
MQLWNTIRVLLIVLSLLAPSMACAVPAAQMSKSEQACCKKMNGQCGSSKMQHSCCRSTIDKSASPMVQGSNNQLHPDLAAVLIPLPSFWMKALPPASLRRFQLEFPPPPPSSGSTRTNVLRI